MNIRGDKPVNPNNYRRVSIALHLSVINMRILGSQSQLASGGLSVQRTAYSGRRSTKLRPSSLTNMYRTM